MFFIFTVKKPAVCKCLSLYGFAETDILFKSSLEASEVQDNEQILAPFDVVMKDVI